MTPSISKILLCILGILIFAVLLEFIPHIWVSWLLLTLLGILAIGNLFLIFRKWKQGNTSRIARRERNLKLLASFMGLFWITGAILYLSAFDCIKQDNFVNSEYFFRSLLGSLNLFLLNIDSNVMDKIGSHDLLKGAISMQAVVSFCTTISLLVGLVYARFHAYLKLWRLSKRKTLANNHVYLFFGLNEPSEMLAKSINETETENGRRTIIFVERAAAVDDETKGWEGIVRLFTHKQKTFIEAEDLNVYITMTDSDLSEIVPSEVKDGDILGKMNLPRIKRIIETLTNTAESQLNILFLSENEDDNLSCASALIQDSTVQSAIESGNVNVRIHCHARQNGINRTLEDVAMTRNIDINIVDYSQLSINELKINPEDHPARVVQFDAENRPTAALTPFNALVVGFNWCGQDALSFLYEYGAFLDGETLRRSHFHCTVVDRDMDSIGGLYRAMHPAVCKNRNPDGSPLVDFKKCDFRSEEFYSEILGPACRKLNYVILAVGDDDQGINLAINIFNYVRRFRTDMSDFRIYVRNYNRSKEKFMERIARHYNEGCDCTADVIRLFGQARRIYSYKLIIDRSYQRSAQRFFARYSELHSDNPDWNIRKLKELGFLDKDEKEIPVGRRKISLDNLRKLRRKEGQDFSNAFHAATKEYVFETVVPEEQRDSFIAKYFKEDGSVNRVGKMADINYPELSEKENEIVRNLAILEHLRWNAAHEMLGYEPTSPEDNIHCCDERRRRHNCLRDWDQLDSESRYVTSHDHWNCDYKAYDFGVIDTTLTLYLDRRLKSPVDGLITSSANLE